MTDPIMAMDGDLAEDYHESHWLATREAGPTAANTTGGGCACN